MAFKGLFACSVGPLKLSLRISSFGYHLLSRRSITGSNFKSGGSVNPKNPLSLPSKSHRLPYELYPHKGQKSNVMIIPQPKNSGSIILGGGGASPGTS